jgi:hypothetical protein
MSVQAPEKKSWVRVATEMEAGVWKSIHAWVTRKPRVPEGATAFPYVSAVSTVLWVFIILSAVEIPIFDLIFHPWPWLRFPILALGIWGLTFMIGFGLSMVVNPHAVGPDGIRIRNGASLDILVPWSAVRGVTMQQRGLEKSKTVQVHEGVVSIAVVSETNVDVEFEHPLTVALPSGDVEATAIRFRADDAAALVRAAREYL